MTFLQIDGLLKYLQVSKFAFCQFTSDELDIQISTECVTELDPTKRDDLFSVNSVLS